MSTGADLDFKLLPWQEEVYNDSTKYKVIAAGRRTGKTFFAAVNMIVKRMESPEGDIVYVAPTQQQARDIMWDLLLDLARPIVTNAHINNMELTFVNGAKIKLKGSDKPDTMRGLKIAYVVLDEYADMKKNVWEEIISPALTDLKGGAIFIGTPKGRNHFYDLYQQATYDETGEYASYHFTSMDNPILDPEEILKKKAILSSYAFKQEFMASFEVKGSEMFKEDWIQFIDEGPTQPGSTYIAVDLAGFEEAAKPDSKRKKNLDDTAIAVVTVNEDGWIIDEVITGRWTLDETALRIFSAVREHSPIKVGIEKGIARQAVMSPLMDLMSRYGRFFHVVELTHGNNKKVDRVMWALQGRFENKLIKLRKGEWNAKFLDQLFQFPNPLVHDDAVDAVAYIDQLADVVYDFDSFEMEYDDVLDDFSGY